jgi:hypothetical protein
VNRGLKIDLPGRPSPVPHGLLVLLEEFPLTAELVFDRGDNRLAFRPCFPCRSNNPLGRSHHVLRPPCRVHP